jgi:uncharacterized protein YjiS (DUF1127 family)
MIVLTLLHVVSGVWIEARTVKAQAMLRCRQLRVQRAASLRVHSQLYEKLQMFMSLVAGRVRTWIVYRETVRELESLDDRELSDLGIGRQDIRDIARQAVR